MCEKKYLGKKYPNMRIDQCLQQTIDKINSDPNLRTLASCCGHGRYLRTIFVQDISNKDYKNGRVFEYYTRMTVKKPKRNRFYKRDKDGYYYHYKPQILFEKGVINKWK